jgi:competence protein ComEC
VEVCFADVGQGSSNLILLGQQRAIVIDAGSSGRGGQTVLALLRYFNITTIAQLIITHNHADHAGGAEQLLTAYAGRIEQVWFLCDRSLSNSRFWQHLEREINSGRIAINRCRRLERDQHPRIIYEQPGLSLDVLAPDFVQNLQAQNPNATCAILLLSIQADEPPYRYVIFAGDSTIAEWRSIIDNYHPRPFFCDILTVPHHAGCVWATDAAAELNWFYTAAVRAKYGIVSVGTDNSYHHPHPEVFAALVQANITPICTQMTTRCTADLPAQ